MDALIILSGGIGILVTGFIAGWNLREHDVRMAYEYGKLAAVEAQIHAKETMRLLTEVKGDELTINGRGSQYYQRRI